MMANAKAIIKAKVGIDSDRNSSRGGDCEGWDEILMMPMVISFYVTLSWWRCCESEVALAVAAANI